MMKTNKLFQQCGGLFFALMACGTVQAAKTVYADVDFLYGTVKVANTDKFHIEAGGLYKATLTDFKFPNTFTGEFGLSITTDETTVKTIMGPGSFTFQATSNTDYWANVFGFAGKPLDLGLYGVKVVQVSSVPLPGAAMLLMSGLVALVGFGRGGAQLVSTPRPADSDVSMPLVA